MYSVIFIAVLAVTVAATDMPGGSRPMKKEEIEKDKTLQTGLDLAVEKYNVDRQNKFGKYRTVAEEIRSASTQVVAGILYRVEVAMVVTSCENTKENSNKKIEECQPFDKPNRRFCTFRILSQPWVKENPLQVLRTDCTIDK